MCFIVQNDLNDQEFSLNKLYWFTHISNVKGQTQYEAKIVID